MRCEEAKDLAGPYRDGELAEPAFGTFQAHLAGCAACQERMAEAGDMALTLRLAAREPASIALEARIRAAIATELPAAWSAGRKWRWPGLDPSNWPGFAYGGSLAAVCAASVLVTWLAVRPPADLGAAHDVVAAHMRSLLQDSPVQVASSESHTVRPWFNGRVDFAPAVTDLAGSGFPLAGARLDYVDGRRVAALVYKRRLHVVNVFVWPSSAAGDSAEQLSQVNGYNLLTWRRGGLVYWMASDLNPAEMRDLRSLL